MKFKSYEQQQAVMARYDSQDWVTLRKSKRLPEPAMEKPITSQKSIIDNDYINKISKTTEKLTPFKIALQSAFPQVAVPIEVGYKVLTNLDTIKYNYNYSITPDDKLKKALNDILKDAVKYIAIFAIQPIKDSVISIIVDNSSKYLDEKRLFKDLTEKLGLDESYVNNFKDFYKTSMKNYLNQEFEEKINPFRQCYV